jgi:hypothetical protein
MAKQPTQKKNPNHGGKRPGSGRPKSANPRISTGLRFTQAGIDALDDLVFMDGGKTTRNEIAERAVVEALRRAKG